MFAASCDAQQLFVADVAHRHAVDQRRPVRNRVSMQTESENAVIDRLNFYLPRERMENYTVTVKVFKRAQTRRDANKGESIGLKTGDRGIVARKCR